MLEALVKTTRPSVARHVQANTPQHDHAEQVIATLLNPSVYVSVDAHYPKALGIANLIAIQKRYYASPWLILRNEAEIPFLTSDYPANPYYHNNDPQRFHVYVPLTPKHALLITPLPDTERMHAHDQDRYGIVKRQQIKLFNRTVVQCAENIVLSDRQSPWIRELIEKYRYWCVESLSDKIPVSESGYYFITRMRAIERKSDEETLPRLSSH